MDHPSLPGAGEAAATTIALAAGLLRAIGEASTTQATELPALTAQADALADRARRLGESSGEAYARARDALARRGEGAGRPPLGPALVDAANLPLELADAGADTAELAAQLAALVDARLAPDAIGAAALAAGASAAAAQLVEVNLSVREFDLLARRAREAAERAQAAAGAAAQATG